MLNKKNINVKDTIKEHSGIKELTDKEKEVIHETYEECCIAYRLENFIGRILIENVHEKDDSIPGELIVSYAEELKAKKKKEEKKK